ncbi:MAG TPA: helix-turn-helix domain-containing protein [Acidobacteriota bacterium]|nr:helix-turn-helix domain-containing protein [Acidobacteriota bacterium]
MRPAMPASAEEIQHAQLSFGDALRRERELRRVALRDVSDATKINLRYLEALERNDFTYLPAGVFTRGFIRSVARFIGADENEMLNAYLYEVGRQERQRKPQGHEWGHVRAHRRAAAAAAEADDRRRLKPLLWILLVVLLAAAAAVGVPYYIHHHAPAAPPAVPTSPMR